jgi:hypothetical protein
LLIDIAAAAVLASHGSEKGAVRSLQRALVTFSRQEVTPSAAGGTELRNAEHCLRRKSRDESMIRGILRCAQNDRGGQVSRVRFFASLRMTGGCSTGTVQNDGRGDVDIAPYEDESCTTQEDFSQAQNDSIVSKMRIISKVHANFIGNLQKFQK